MAPNPDATSVLSSIQNQRTTKPLAILNLAEPILSNQQPSQTQRPTDHDTSHSTANESSEASDNNLTPANLSADLAHYQSLFSKLRFSYLEQVTKEKYLRSIVGDPPVLVSHEENTALEEKLVGMKNELKSKKEGVDLLVVKIEELAREVADRYEGVNAGVSDLERLPREIADLEEQVKELRERLREKEDAMDVDIDRDPRMKLGLKETQDLVEEQRRKAKEVDELIQALQKDMPAKMRECERAERELDELESKRNEVTRLAREVRRIKEEGGRDTLEEQGRWYKASDTVLKGLLGVEV